MNKFSTEWPNAYEQKLTSPLISTIKIKRFMFYKAVIHKKNGFAANLSVKTVRN